MNYEKIYNSIIERAKSRTNLEYSEEHHIIPRCLGGLDEKSNLVLLTPEEHFISHLLLVKIHPKNNKLVFAANMMSVANSLQKRVSNKRYGWLKKLHQAAASENGKKNKGRKATKEQCENIKNAKLGSKNPMFGKSGKDHPTYGMNRKGQGKGIKKGPRSVKVERTLEWNKKYSETRIKDHKPSFNIEGYEILTPTGFQPFHGVSYNGIVECLEFTTSSNKKIIVSKKHKFTDNNKIAKEYKIGEQLLTKDGLEEIISINIAKKRKEVYDILEVSNGNLYLANDIVNHNCEIIKDDNYAIIPEFNASLKKKIVKEWDRAPFYDSYVAMDIGMKDLTVVLFAWMDFVNNKLIVEDEYVINGQKFNTTILAEGIKKKESLNFSDKLTGEEIPPYLRISDNNLIVIKDLYDLHGLRFLPTRKDDADAALNKVRILLQNEEIIINPRCVTLITHLEAGIWNKSKNSFERSADNGHFDAIDSLKYLVRNVQFTKNPYPNGFLNKKSYDQFNFGGQSKHPQENQFNKMFNVKQTTSDKNQQLVSIFNPKKRLF